MFSKNTLKVIEFFARHRTEKFNINQLARTLKISPGSSHKILKELEENTIVRYEKWGNQLFYQLNLEDKKARKLVELVLIIDKEQREKGAFRDLEKIDADCIVVFDKLQKSTLALIIAEKILHEKIKAKLPANVDPIILTLDDAKEKLRSKEKTIVQLLESGIVLEGENIVVEVMAGVQ